MQIVSMSAVIAAYGDAGGLFFSPGVMLANNRELDDTAILNGTSTYFWASERQANGARVFMAYCMDTDDRDVVQIGGSRFGTRVGAGLMRDRAYAHLWTARLIATLPRIASLIRTGRKRDRAAAETLAMGLGGSLTGAGTDTKLRWTNALGQPSDDAIPQLLTALHFDR
jgi:hypothetical protein